FISSSISRSYSSSGFPVITFPISIEGGSITRSVLAAYLRYLDYTPIPTIALSLVGNDQDSMRANTDLIGNILKQGGI
ncbi:MAG: hypothetical protein ABR515_03405, partial [Nitrososphaeraceae archaeon]